MRQQKYQREWKRAKYYDMKKQKALRDKTATEAIIEILENELTISKACQTKDGAAKALRDQITELKEQIEAKNEIIEAKESKLETEIKN